MIQPENKRTAGKRAVPLFVRFLQITIMCNRMNLHTHDRD